MDRTFQKFLKSGISLAAVGLERREENLPYFCTPMGAEIFGWAGVDGIHFCLIRSFGSMVFAVSPENTAPDYVHPLAKNFADFLRLLLACGDTAALEQAWMWNEAQFDAFLRENPPTQEQREVLALTADTLKLTPMEHPFAYLRALQADFDPGKLRYSAEYEELVGHSAAQEPGNPEWKVWFDGNFWGHRGSARAGTPMMLNREFDWAGRHWLLPAIYVCSQGLVLDLCMRAEAPELRRFWEKWKKDAGAENCGQISREQRMQMKLENPLDFDVSVQTEVNQKPLSPTQGCCVCFCPCLPDAEQNDPEAVRAVRHYGLDETCGWAIRREAFSWAGSRRPALRSVTLTMQQLPVSIPGPHFSVHAPGDCFTFSSPVSAATYTLTVQSLERQTIAQPRPGSDRWFYPTHFTAMHYTLSPQTDEPILVFDCEEGDRPLKIEIGSDGSSSDGAVIGIIGGADGPTAIAGRSDDGRGLHAACSALHFEPVQGDTQWRVEFCARESEPAVFRIL